MHSKLSFGEVNRQVFYFYLFAFWPQIEFYGSVGEISDHKIGDLPPKRTILNTVIP